MCVCVIVCGCYCVGEGVCVWDSLDCCHKVCVRGKGEGGVCVCDCVGGCGCDCVGEERTVWV